MSNYELHIAPERKKTEKMSYERTVEYVKNHLDLRPRRLLAERTGRSIGVIYDVLRKLGHGSPDGFDHRKPELDAKIAEVYPNHSNKWIAHHLHCGEGTIDRCRKRLGLKKDPEYLKEISRRRSEYGSRKRTQEEIDKCQRSLAKTRMMENFRVNSGMKQKTRLKLKRIPTRVYRAIWHLENRYGYIRTTDPYVLWFDEETRRTPFEDLWRNKYGLTIEQAEE